MASYRKRNTDGPNSEDKALDLFAEMMIEKLETIGKDWKKPWFTEGALQWPRNLSGREYNGMNALMLMLHCEKGRIYYSEVLHLRLRAETEQAGQGRRGTAEGFGTER